ncbi:MAG TPA: hypothetical protein VHN14_30085 [Kofleriaceae bacterium]|jgi:hypothetical protein|nr:hypothetical protein [Kofleriaceae bacterium]
MGCTNCKSKTGCDHRKGAMMTSVDQALARLYPTRTWGEPDDQQSAGLPADELAALADELASTLGAATFVRTGGDDEPCDYIYVLSMGRTPCIIQVRDHGVPVPAEWHALGGTDDLEPWGRGTPTDLPAMQGGGPGGSISELYLRLVVSQRARVAAVQQVTVELIRAQAGFLVREQPRAGVYDAPLLSRMQKLVATLPAYELLHVDFGEIAHAPPGYHAGIWRELFGGEPAIANYLFYTLPTTMIATGFIAG